MKITLLVFALSLTVLSGCKKIDKMTQFVMEYNETLVIPATTGINLPFNFFSPNVTSNAQTTFSIHDTRKDLIEEIRLTKFDLTLTSPSNGDFGFLKSVEIFISADGLPEVRIAWNVNVPANIGKYLDLYTAETDLKEYIKKDEFSLRVKTETDEVLSSDHHINMHSAFFVDAKILGQ